MKLKAMPALGRLFRLIFEDKSETKSHSIAEQAHLIVLNAFNKWVSLKMMLFCRNCVYGGIFSVSQRWLQSRLLVFNSRLLVAKSGSEHYTMRMSAVMASNNLEGAFGLNSITGLIITFSMKSAMKCADRCPAALNILNAVLNYCSLGSMPHLENIIMAIRRTLCEGPAQSQPGANILKTERKNLFGIG